MLVILLLCEIKSIDGEYRRKMLFDNKIMHFPDFEK